MRHQHFQGIASSDPFTITEPFLKDPELIHLTQLQVFEDRISSTRIDFSIRPGHPIVSYIYRGLVLTLIISELLSACATEPSVVILPPLGDPLDAVSLVLMETQDAEATDFSAAYKNPSATPGPVMLSTEQIGQICAGAMAAGKIESPGECWKYLEDLTGGAEIIFVTETPEPEITETPSSTPVPSETPLPPSPTPDTGIPDTMLTEVASDATEIAEVEPAEILTYSEARSLIEAAYARHSYMVLNQYLKNNERYVLEGLNLLFAIIDKEHGLMIFSDAGKVFFDVSIGEKPALTNPIDLARSRGEFGCTDWDPDTTGLAFLFTDDELERLKASSGKLIQDGSGEYIDYTFEEAFLEIVRGYMSGITTPYVTNYPVLKVVVPKLNDIKALAQEVCDDLPVDDGPKGSEK